MKMSNFIFSEKKKKRNFRMLSAAVSLGISRPMKASVFRKNNTCIKKYFKLLPVFSFRVWR